MGKSIGDPQWIPRESIGNQLKSMESLGNAQGIHRYPIDFRFIPNGSSIDLLRISNRFLLDSLQISLAHPWTSCGFPSLWIPDGFPMEFLLDSYRILISFSWIPFGFPMHSLGIPWIAIDFPWIPQGSTVDPRWTFLWILQGLIMDCQLHSIWIPYGFPTIPDGLPLDSLWIPNAIRIDSLSIF